jgi:hypothetical protein
MLAPILFFAYKRIEHTKAAIDSLKANSLAHKSDLIVFCDGAKNQEEVISVKKVRDFLRTVTGFKTVLINESPINLGLSKSIIDGVESTLLNYDKVIVLEDDIITSPYFLQYMNDALKYYEKIDNVISIHGWTCPTTRFLPETFFLRGADCWGWGTWSRAWGLLERDPEILLKELQNRSLTYAFDFNGAYPYTAMLESCIAGRIDSWAIRWHASAFLLDKLTLYPALSLVHNIGNDGSGTHGGNTDSCDVYVSQRPISVSKIQIEHSLIGFNAFRDYFLSDNSFLKRMTNKFHRFVRYVSR